MSANPEAFDYLRKAAYRFVQKHGKDSRKLHDHCVSMLADWRKGDGAGGGLTDAEAEQIVGDVTHWTITRYNPPRKKAERSREERAATQMMSPVLLEFAAEIYGSATVRNASRVSDQSKTTVARHLRQQGISPKRKKKIDTLPARVKWLVAILDKTFPGDGAALVMADHLAAAVWDKAARPLPETARSTQSTRRKKLAEYIAAVSGAGLGFHLIVSNDVIAVRRGRRFKGMKDTAIWIDDERALRGTRGILLPDAAPVDSLFWDDRWLNNVLEVLQIGLCPWFTDPVQLEPLLRLTRPVLDPRPLYHLFHLVIQRGGYNFADDLHGLAERVHDSAIRKAAHDTANYIMLLSVWAQYGNPFDYFGDAEREIPLLRHMRDVAPDSYAKAGYVKDRLFREFAEEFKEEPNAIQKTLDRCKQLSEMERQGAWTAPTTAELARYRPDNEPPF